MQGNFFIADIHEFLFNNPVVETIQVISTLLNTDLFYEKYYQFIAYEVSQ